MRQGIDGKLAVFDTKKLSPMDSIFAYVATPPTQLLANNKIKNPEIKPSLLELLETKIV